MKRPKISKKVWNEAVKRLATRGGWTTGLIVLSSAALGGIAVALWNRKALATFRELELGENTVAYKKEHDLNAEHEDEFF